jgi:hypothetical protein
VKPEAKGLHPQIAIMVGQYARDLAQAAPSTELDARIDHLVATHRVRPRLAPRPRPRRLHFYAAAAGFALLAIAIGIFIGMRLEQFRRITANQSPRDTAWPPADLTMWPTDSVSFQIPAEYSAQGTLVAVDPNSKNTATRYWIDVVVSNDGTFRIERIVPAEPAHSRKGHDGKSQAQ